MAPNGVVTADSAADEVEHIAPKALFPERVFDWTNYIYACGPCNGPKSNRYSYVTTSGEMKEFIRTRGGGLCHLQRDLTR